MFFWKLRPNKQNRIDSPIVHPFAHPTLNLIFTENLEYEKLRCSSKSKDSDSSQSNSGTVIILIKKKAEEILVVMEPN